MNERFLACLALAALPGCGTGADEAGDAGTYERLTLRPEREDVLATSLFRRFVLDPEAGEDVPWRIEATSREVVRVRDPDGGQDRPAIEIQGERGVGVVIEGPFEPESFNRVAITLVPTGTPNLQVRAEAPGRTHVRSRSIRLDRGRDPITLLFDLPEVRQSDRAWQTLVVESLSGRSRFAILHVDLLHRPWEEWLAPGGDLPELVDVGGTERRAYGVATTRSLLGSFDVDTRDELVFSFGIPQALRRGGDRPVLRVVLATSGRSDLAREYALEPDLDAPSAWHVAAIDLASFAGERVEARFELRSPLGGVGVAALGEPALASRSRTAPTFVLITSDTHRGDHLGVAPDGAGVRTPFLDSLAGRGMLFEDCLSSTNVTKPSHISLMTGVTPRDTGVFTNEAHLADDAPTLAEAFRAAGYVTLASVSCSPLGHRTSGLGQGFDRMAAPRASQHVSTYSIRALRDWLPDFEGLPLFAWLHVFDAHAPYDTGADYEHLYYPEGKDPSDPSLPEPPLHSIPDWKKGVRDLDYLVGLYKSEISSLDTRLAELFEEPRLRDATVAFTADHGESLTAHAVYFDHRELYPDTLRVPLILAGPGVPAGRRVDRAVHHLDLGRTLLELAGLATEFPGQNLLELAGEPDAPPRYSMSANAYSAAVQAGRWFGVLHIRDRPKHTREGAHRYPLHSFELYDLEADPGCTRDLAGEDHETASKVRRLLVDWLAQASARTWLVTAAERDAEALADLAELGYASGDVGPPAGGLWFDPECGCERCLAYR